MSGLLCLAVLHWLLRVQNSSLSNTHLYFDPFLWLPNENEGTETAESERQRLEEASAWHLIDFLSDLYEETGVYVYEYECVCVPLRLPEESMVSGVAVVTVITFNSASGRKREDKGGVAAV